MLQIPIWVNPGMPFGAGQLYIDFIGRLSDLHDFRICAEMNRGELQPDMNIITLRLSHCFDFPVA